MIDSVGLSMENKRNPVVIQIPERGPISFKSLKWENKGKKGLDIKQLYFVYIFPMIGLMTSSMGKLWRMILQWFGKKETPYLERR